MSDQLPILIQPFHIFGLFFVNENYLDFEAWIMVDGQAHIVEDHLDYRTDEWGMPGFLGLPLQCCIAWQYPVTNPPSDVVYYRLKMLANQVDFPNISLQALWERDTRFADKFWAVLNRLLQPYGLAFSKNLYRNLSFLDLQEVALEDH